MVASYYREAPMQVQILKDKPESPWRTISKAFDWRFADYKWGTIIGHWFLWMFLIGIGFYALYFATCYVAFGWTLPKVENWQTYLYRHSAWVPGSVVATSLLWAIDLGIMQRAIEQVRGAPFAIPKITGYLRRWHEFLLVALVSQIASLLLSSLLFMASKSYAASISLMIQPLAGAPFLFVLPLMADRHLSLKEAAATSLKATKPWLASCIVVFWILQMVTAIGLILCFLPWSRTSGWWPFLLIYGSFIVYIASFALMPIPFIGVAILYRNQFGDPEVVKPPVVADPAASV